MITTRRMLMLYACLVPVALTGCDLADYFPNVPQPVPVISPGYQVDIDGHPVRISGFDDCPREKDEARHAAAQDEKGCIVLSCRAFRGEGQTVSASRRRHRNLAASSGKKTLARTILFACSARTVRCDAKFTGERSP